MVARDQADRRAGGGEHRVREGVAKYVTRTRSAAARPRDQRRQGHRSPRDHPHALRAPPGEDGRRRAAHLRPRRAALSRRLSSGCRAGGDACGDDGLRPRVPHERPRARGARGGAASTASSARRNAEASAARADARAIRAARRVAPAAAPRGRSAARRTTTRAGPSSSHASPRASRCTRARSRACARKRSRRGATATRRCSARWRPRASSSTTRSSREAMKDSGIGTPATRAAIIERLIDVGYIEREGARAGGHREGHQRGGAARPPRAHVPRADGGVGAPARATSSGGSDSRKGFMNDIASFARGDRHRARREAQRRAHSAREPRARARSAAATSSRTARATRAGRATTPGAAS